MIQKSIPGEEEVRLTTMVVISCFSKGTASVASAIIVQPSPATDDTSATIWIDGWMNGCIKQTGGQDEWMNSRMMDK